MATQRRVVRELQANGALPQTARLRSSKFPNNVVEQDHRSVKLRIGPMLGVKQFENAAITIAGIELMHHIRKGQFSLPKLRPKDASAPAVWSTVLATQ